MLTRWQMLGRTRKPLFSPDEVRVETFKSSGPGGQHKNKRETAVRLRHLPSGITVLATEHRSQAKNKALAFYRLEVKLRSARKKKKARIPTVAPRAHKESVLMVKHHRSRIKGWRKKPTPSD
jgi:protein subunit release factor B